MFSNKQDRFRHFFTCALGALTLSVACGGTGGADDIGLAAVAGDGELKSGELASEGNVMSEGELGTLEQALCENTGGTNTVMTAIAVAAGRELRRWKPETDFKWNTSTGQLELTAAGMSRCGASTAPGGGMACLDTWNPVLPPVRSKRATAIATPAGWAPSVLPPAGNAA